VASRIELREVTREDVARLARWLQDEEVSHSWFGRYPSGEPVHLGYIPSEVLHTSLEEWGRVFNDPRRHIFSIFVSNDIGPTHVGEAQIVMEEPLGNAELAILIGRKDLWGRGYGTAAMRALLERAFIEYGAYRAWVDVPEDNLPALRMCQKLGFTSEGLLRESRPHGDHRCNTIIMGLLVGEYAGLEEPRLVA